MENWDAIISSDWHLRDTLPRCRTDDFIKAQTDKLHGIIMLQNELGGIPIIVSGDLFHKWKVSHSFESYVFNILKYSAKIICIPGNHDLPAHNIKRVKESVFGVFNNIGAIQSLDKKGVRLGGAIKCYGFPYGSELKACPKTENSINIAIVHQFVYKNKQPFPGAETHVDKLIKKLPGYDLIVTGDNHTPFIHRLGNQLLINPGSLTRQSASETHKPRVYLWSAKSNKIKKHFLPFNKKAVSRKHIEKTEERDKRIDQFIEQLKTGFKHAISFEENLKKYLSKNKKKIDKGVINKILKAAE